jgi:phenylalanyl-tRNA synthetase beta subunit
LGFTETYTYSLVDSDNGLKIKNPLSSDLQYLRTSLIPSHLKIISQNHGKSDSLNFFEISNVYIPQTTGLPKEEMRLIISTTNPDYYRLKGIIETVLADTGLPQIIPDIKTYPQAIVWEAPLQPLFQKVSSVKTYSPISKFSPIIEDVNINLVGSYAFVEKKIRSVSNLIKQIEVIDKYGQKLTLRITYHSDSRQLSDADIAPVREKISRLSPLP